MAHKIYICLNSDIRLFHALLLKYIIRVCIILYYILNILFTILFAGFIYICLRIFWSPYRITYHRSVLSLNVTGTLLCVSKWPLTMFSKYESQTKLSLNIFFRPPVCSSVVFVCILKLFRRTKNILLRSILYSLRCEIPPFRETICPLFSGWKPDFLIYRFHVEFYTFQKPVTDVLWWKFH